MVQLSLIGKASLKRWYLVWILTCVCAKSLQSCLTLCDHMDCSPPGSSVRGIFQAKILEWVAMLFSRGSSWCRDWTCISCAPALQVGSLLLSHWGSPLGICLKKTKTQIRNNMCTIMFITALFTIAKIWELPKCPSGNEQIKNMWYTYTQRNITHP